MLGLIILMVAHLSVLLTEIELIGKPIILNGSVKERTTRSPEENEQYEIYIVVYTVSFVGIFYIQRFRQTVKPH